MWEDRVAGRRAILEWLDAADWPLTVETIDVAARWNTTDQYRWSIGLVLAGIGARGGMTA